MKLYLICGPCTQKFNIPYLAATRHALALQIRHSFNITCPHCNTELSANTGLVRAESSYKLAQVPTTLGTSAIGIFFGPIGLGIGFLAGLAAGSGIKNSDKTEVNHFNNS